MADYLKINKGMIRQMLQRSFWRKDDMCKLCLNIVLWVSKNKELIRTKRLLKIIAPNLRFLTGDESWVFQCDPKRKPLRME